MKKKTTFIIIFTLILTTQLYSQSTQLDFSMTLQNTNTHQALIYPNPISEPIFKIKSSSVIVKIEIADMLGKHIYTRKIKNYSFNELTIDLPKCKKGVYLVKIIFDDNDYIIKKLLYK